MDISIMACKIDIMDMERGNISSIVYVVYRKINTKAMFTETGKTVYTFSVCAALSRCYIAVT